MLFLSFGLPASGLIGCVSSGSSGSTVSASPGAIGFAGFEQPLRELEEYDGAITRSTLRESALELLEAAAFEDSALLRANALEAMHPVPSRVEPLARAGLTDENTGVRFTSLMTIGKLKLQGSRQFVGPLLDDPDPRVRMAALYALHRLGERVDQTPFAQHLLSGESSIRSQAAYILGEIGNPSAIPLLRDTAAPPRITNESTNRQELDNLRRRIDQTLFRLQVAEALLKLGDERVRHVVHSALYPKYRDDLEAAVLAAQILGELKDDTAIRQLVELIEQTTPESPDTTDPRRKIFIQPIELRLAAATAVAKMGDTGGVYVADLALSSDDPAVRSQACFLYSAAALARDRGTAGREARRLDMAKLEHLMQDPSPIVQISAAAGLLRVLESR